MARHVFQPSSVFSSTLLPSLTVYTPGGCSPSATNAIDMTARTTAAGMDLRMTSPGVDTNAPRPESGRGAHLPALLHAWREAVAHAPGRLNTKSEPPSVVYLARSL